ncbi:MAG TPA: twin-arginine translocation signal domain-containing protein, partial [Herpetosiphonaceae bacterium]|nr:twin-arginine translocation signal domain-containing protein [Herpetosiphonaceae bacterium]
MSTKNQRGPRRVDISRREFLRMAGVGSSALLLAACGGTPVAQDPPTAAPVATTAGEAATSAPAAASGATTKLTFWTPGGSQVFCPAMWTNIMNTYSKANPQISFEEIQCGTGDQAFEEVLLARIAAGNPP